MIKQYVPLIELVYKPSHMTQILVTVGAKLWIADPLLVDPWSMD